MSCFSARPGPSRDLAPRHATAIPQEALRGQQGSGSLALIDGKPYEEWLRHPRWQRMRLYVMDARGWACEKCGDAESELQVHHTYYERGKKPWEYHPDTLQCICRKCHRKVHRLPDEPEPAPESVPVNWTSLKDDHDHNILNWIFGQIGVR